MLTENKLQVDRAYGESKPRGIRNLPNQASVRELEVMAVRLRDAGDEKGADYLERQALALLDRKICRKALLARYPENTMYRI
ncbi:MAG: hypothetical protein P8163_14010 [Candidatus Thiodiazotropha sp.]